MDWRKEFPRQEFLDLIAGGQTEMEALVVLNEQRAIDGKRSPFEKNVLVQLQVAEPSFRENLDEAKKLRADVWFSGIVKSVNSVVEKEEVPAEKLKFEQRKYLAAIDNPDKYSEKKALDINIGMNIFAEMKALSGESVRKIMLESDPFALVESVVVDAELVDNSGEDNEEDIFG